MDDSLNPIGDLPGDMEDPIGGIAALPGRSPIVGTGLLLTVLALAGGVWLMRRRMYQGPKAFVQEPQIFYDRLTNWTDRLRLALRPALTPYERSALLAEQIPQGSAFIARITEIYVQFRYAPGSGQMAAETQQDLNSNWRQLRSVLWRTWLRQKFQLKK